MRSSTPADTNLPLSRVAAVAIGNGLEFYDFLTFSFFAVQIGHCFFPDSRQGLLFTLATFGVGFLARPVGGLVIGRFGDRAGRKPAMLLSFALMGTGITGLGLTPAYRTIGLAAPILLVVFRLLQGFALGGEVGASTAFLVEAAPRHRRGLYLSLQSATQYLAVLAAGLMAFALAALLPPAALDAYGWRIAFLAGAAIVPFGLLMRRNLPETLDAPERPADAALAGRLSARVVVTSLLILGAGTIGAYSIDYMAVYAQDTLKMPPVLAFGSTIVTGVVGITASVLSGLLCDRIGRKRLMLTAVALQILLVLPVFLFISSMRTAAALYGGIALVGMLQNFGDTPALLLITETLPKRMRAGALSIIYATAIACFGGSTQFIIKALLDATGNPLAPAAYMTAALVVGAGAMLMMRETAPALVVAEAVPA
jgi:MFS family permease